MITNLIKFSSLIEEIKNLRKHIKNLSIYFLATIITSFIGVMINPFLAANLSPHDYAIIGYFTSFNSLILSIISFSFLSYYLRNYYKIREDERQAVLNTLLISQLLLGMIALLFVFVGFYLYMDIVKVNFPFFPFVL